MGKRKLGLNRPPARQVIAATKRAEGIAEVLQATVAVSGTALAATVQLTPEMLAALERGSKELSMRCRATTKRDAAQEVADFVDSEVIADMMKDMEDPREPLLTFLRKNARYFDAGIAKDQDAVTAVAATLESGAAIKDVALRLVQLLADRKGTDAAITELWSDLLLEVTASTARTALQARTWARVNAKPNAGTYEVFTVALTRATGRLTVIYNRSNRGDTHYTMDLEEFTAKFRDA